MRPWIRSLSEKKRLTRLTKKCQHQKNILPTNKLSKSRSVHFWLFDVKIAKDYTSDNNDVKIEKAYTSDPICQNRKSLHFWPTAVNIETIFWQTKSKSENIITLLTEITYTSDKQICRSRTSLHFWPNKCRNRQRLHFWPNKFRNRETQKRNTLLTQHGPRVQKSF